MSCDTDTHYIPMFTKVNERGEQESACREFVPARLVAPLGVKPTCWGCAAWLHSLDLPPRQKPEHPARVLAQITAGNPWGHYASFYYCERCGDEMKHPPESGLCFRCELDSDQSPAAAVAVGV